MITEIDMLQPRQAARRLLRNRARRYVLNCVPSLGTGNDWTFQDARMSGLSNLARAVPGRKDLRAAWWKIDDQGSTGACVGYSTAYGVLCWHYVQAGLLSKARKPSARFIWMANKETDGLTRYPTTFLESEGTQTKLALGVARKFGCVPDDILPMNGPLSPLPTGAFYARAARFRISSYHNLGRDLDDWRAWIANQGPILTRLEVDDSWDLAAERKGHLRTYQADTARGGHAVCIVGYTQQYFIVRNSWGTGWGDGGFAYAWNDYAAQAFTEAYGAVL
jgi:hypothetical protein